MFFAPSETSRTSGIQALGRIHQRAIDRDTDTTWATRNPQYAAVCEWGYRTTPPSNASRRGRWSGRASPTVTTTSAIRGLNIKRTDAEVAAVISYLSELAALGHAQ